MLQAVPELERAPLLLGAGDAGAVPPAAVSVAADAWRSADHYYLRSIGRIQRLREVHVCMWLREGRRLPSTHAISDCAFLEHQYRFDSEMQSGRYTADGRGVDRTHCRH
jgi:hypothetical protein